MSLDFARDFLQSTREFRATPRGAVLNEATKHNYFFFSRMFQDAEKNFKGGTKLTARVQGPGQSNFEFYDPNQQFSASDSSALETLEVPWAFATSHAVYQDEQVELNGGVGDEDRFLEFVKAKDQQCLVDTVNGMEDALWATPVFSTMEATNVNTRVPYSILAFVTRDGLAPSIANGDGVTADWTSLQTLDPDLHTWYRNAARTYDSAQLDDPDSGLVNSFDRLLLDTGFETPDPLAKYQDNAPQRNRCIVTNDDGLVTYNARMRQLNDRMAMFHDPDVKGAQFQGVPIKRIDTLNDLGWTEGQPDYLFLDLEHLCPYIKSNRYMHSKVTDGGINHPNAVVDYKFTWYNLFVHSRRRQGRLSAA